MGSDQKPSGCVRAKSLQSCPTLCDPMDCSPLPRLLCPWDSPAKNTGVDCHLLLHQKTRRSLLVLVDPSIQQVRRLYRVGCRGLCVCV